jgi:hypothetical protein
MGIIEMKNDTTISIRIPSEIRQQLEDLAAENCRSLGGQALHFLKLSLSNINVTSEPKSILKDTKTKVSRPHDVAAQVWLDYMEVRRAKKSPITESAINQLRAEADKAGWSLNEAVMECCSRGWLGFKAEWVNKAGKQQALENSNQQAAEAFING